MSLKEAFSPYFKVGVALSRWNINTADHLELAKKEFNSITSENDMKPMYFMDEEETLKNPEKYNECPAMNFNICRPYLDWAKENGIPMRGHTLAWHNQTPLWFFRENYDMEAGFASRELILTRLENYIKSVLEFVQTEYPGVIYAWDVVNEVVDEGGFRKKWSMWYETVGEDFFIKAFEFARKYVAEGVKLFYNDYSTYEDWKREFICESVLKPLMEKGLVDGMGMQSHLLMDEPTMESYKKALETYGATGLTIHITELDIHNNDPSEESQKALAERYKQLFEILVNAKKEGKANVECVTFWNLRDQDSWLSFFRKEKSYPLLFDDNCEPKAAYHAVMSVVE